ncbi:MAG: putative acetyltransferase [Flavobacteriaceae bacterium]|jgi:putative acetyltransferase
MSTPIIRSIERTDNAATADVIRLVLIELGVPKVGTAYEDKSLDAMFENYEKDKATYFVVEEDGKVIGGAGISHLDNHNGNVCELQKMYFSPLARGRGIGTKMIDLCLNQAREYGYEQCYIETMSYMKAAQKLYRTYGFEYMEGPIGDTGHYSCGVHMILDL